jgi:hypothetical protein
VALYFRNRSAMLSHNVPTQQTICQDIANQLHICAWTPREEPEYFSPYIKFKVHASPRSSPNHLGRDHTRQEYWGCYKCSTSRPLELGEYRNPSLVFYPGISPEFVLRRGTTSASAEISGCCRFKASFILQLMNPSERIFPCPVSSTLNTSIVEDLSFLRILQTPSPVMVVFKTGFR